jgi:hypothetical protein
VLQYKGPMRGGRVVVVEWSSRRPRHAAQTGDAMPSVPPFWRDASEGRFERIVIEDLNVSGMSKNHAIAGPAVCLHSSSRRWQHCRKGEQHVDTGKRKGRYS